MNKILIAVAASLALTSFTTAYAAPQDSKTDSVQIKAPEGYRMQSQDFAEYAYGYHLDNDDTIHFTQKVAHYFAQIKGQGKVEMFPVSEGVFVTAAGTRVEFQDDGYSVTISNYERLPMAQTMAPNTIVMAKR